MKFIYKIFLRMDVIFRDKFNETSLIMIGYSDVTVTTTNYFQIIRSMASLATVLLQCHGCGDSFIIWLYLVPVISGPKLRNFFHAKPNAAMQVLF